MAFWKRLGKKHAQPEKPSISSTPNQAFKAHNNNDSSLSLSTTGDLGESLFNNLQLSPSSHEDSFFTSKNGSRSIDNSSGEFGDLGDIKAPEMIRPWSRRSRLSKNLQEVLADLTALSFFQQFLETKQATTYLSLLNDVKNYYLLATSLSTTPLSNGSPVVNGDGMIDTKWSPYKTSDSLSKGTRLLNSTSSSSGFSDDISLDSPGHRIGLKTLETDTMVHSLLCERRRIVQKYFEPESSDFLPSISGLLNREVDLGDSCDISADFFQRVQNGVCSLLESEYFSEYLHSEFHYRHQLEIITGGKLLITDVLYCDTCLFYFMEYMDQEGKRHWLEFWLATDNYRSQWTSSNAASDALIIYNKYFSLQATQPLGLADVIRSTIEENICVANAGPGPDCFESALHVLLSAMDKNYLHPFLSSPVFCQYMNEIMSSLKSSSHLLSLSRSKRSGSTSTINSEVSAISTSTAASAAVGPSVSSLAAGATSPLLSVNNTESSMMRIVNSISNESLVIDIRQLNDPDHLWQRKKLTLSLGKLSPLGRFYTDIEPPPDKKIESKLSKAVRKFVFVEEDQEKEEAAWLVAERIVRDIIAITLENHSDLNCTESSSVVVPAIDVTV